MLEKLKNGLKAALSGARSLFSDDRQELETKLDYSMEMPKKVGLVIVTVTFVGFGGWALLAPIAGAAIAPGSVVVSSYRQAVQHLEGGIVSNILVKNGQTVKKGDVLIALDETQIRAQLEISRSQYFVSAATRARLIAERDGAEKVEYSEQELPRNEAEAVLAIQDQNEVFAARKRARDGEKSVLQQRVDQLIAQGEGLKELQKSKEALAASYAEEIEDFEALFAEGFSDKVQLRELKRSAYRLEGEIADNKAAMARLSIQVGETRLQLLQLEKDFQAMVADELSQVQASIFDLEERITAARDRVERTRIASPADGIAMALNVHTVGAVVGAGEKILDVVPQAQELVVEARVTPADIDRVHNGQDAEVGFSIFSKTFPKLIGAVESVSADALVDESSGESYYLARVTIPDAEFSKLEGEILQPGMPAEVYIQSGSRTLFQYLMKPVRTAFSRSLTED